MDREIRRVAPLWSHPLYTTHTAPHPRLVGKFIPLQDASFEEARREWEEEYGEWQAKGREAGEDFYDPPKAHDFMPQWTETEATWWQAYENVSEGTPISPALPTAEALIDWLCTNVDYWGYGPVSRSAAENFVGGGYAPSAVISGGQMRVGIECADLTGM